MQRRQLIAAPLLCAVVPRAVAQTFPSKPLTIVVPATPGGAIDLAARLIGAKFTAAWSQPVNIENKGGAAGMLGSDQVAKAAPDGHMLALVASSHAINPSIYKKLPFDTVKAFEPVVQTHVVPLVLVVSNSLPAKTLPELIAHLKANPGKYSFASSGTGGAPHMSAELFKTMAGVDLVHVPYKGSTAAHTDLISGRVPVMFDTVAAISGQIKSGNVRAIAVTTSKRSGVLPDVPTIAEANKALASPDVREKLAAAAIEPAGGSPAQFADFIQSEMQRWAKVAKVAGV